MTGLKRKTVLCLTLLICTGCWLPSFAQQAAVPDRPKLVVGIVVDQMRWDFLHRYAERYAQGGFKRLLREGFSADNCQIPYAQTVTAAGHACVYTGSVPALNGIAGNEWYDRGLGRSVYCVEDTTVKIVGGVPLSEPMSPANLWPTTISDEMRLASNFRSKTIAVSLKDRGSILPGGHTGEAFWYEGANGNFVTSTYYMQDLPSWVKQFNNRKLVDSFYKLNWQPLYPLNTYVQSDTDTNTYEGVNSAMPKTLAAFAGKNFDQVRGTPWGNTLTLEFAKQAVLAEKLGSDAFADMLAVSLSSTDYVGHAYGPNSIETEDTYLRLDKDLEAFFNFLDKQVGKNEYLVFLTADHGVAHVPGFLQKHKVKVSTVGTGLDLVNAAVAVEFGAKDIISDFANFQLYLNEQRLGLHGERRDSINYFIIKELKKMPHVLTAFSYSNKGYDELPTQVRERFLQGHNAQRSGDIQIILKPGFFYGGPRGTTHGTWYPYDSHIPMVFMGWKVKHGATSRPVYMTDISATVAAMLHIQMPSACIGQALKELTDSDR